VSAAIEARDVCVKAGKTRILGPLDLRVEEGEHVLVVGRSGSGKTTLLRAVAGLARLETGTVSLFGRPVTEGRRHLVEPRERGVGMLFQGGALWPHMSAAGNLRFVLARQGLSRADRKRRVGELLSLVQLEGYEKRMPATLSGGEAQRLSLARALACDPRILLLDEPLGPLDAELRGDMLDRLGELDQRLGLTVLHVTHDPREAERLADRTLRMEDGRIVPSGSEAPAREAPRPEETVP
jgi:ABC-type Fe3+/spermidine/putrescine transport system ATPase subunit